MRVRGRSIAAVAVLPVAAALVVLVSIAGTGSGAGAAEKPPGSTPMHPASTDAPAIPTGQKLPGTTCPAFPADNVWNTPITGLPVNKNNARWLATMAASSTNLHPDFGPPPNLHYGIPWQIAPATQPFVHVTFGTPAESDRVPYPFGANTPIEGGQTANGDRHAIMVDKATCTLFELYAAHYRPGGKSTAGSGAVWKLTSNHLRPAGWTSADAAGLPILPGLVNYDEVVAGHLDHAIRFTTSVTARSYIWPGRHQAGSGGASDPPMGARFRLKASFTLPASQCNSMCRTVIKAMKTYGLILADNGSDWYFQGTDDSRWARTAASNMIEQLKAIPAHAFQAVDESCLMLYPNSGQALQPGTAAYTAKCG